jgi:hypothetical protein
MLVILLAIIFWAQGPGFHGPQLSTVQVQDLTSEYSDWNASHMVEIFYCESRFHPLAISPTSDVGLPQINRVHWDRFHPLLIMISPQYAVYAAHEIWLMQGYNAWACNRKVS